MSGADLELVTDRPLLREAARDVAAATGLEIERTVREVARICYFDPLGLVGPDGRLLPLQQISADFRACIASMDFDLDTGQVTRIKLCDKNSALEKAMKHHGLYERDNPRRAKT